VTVKRKNMIDALLERIILMREMEEWQGNRNIVGCDGILRNHDVEFLGFFIINLGYQKSIFAEIIIVINAMERSWRKLWIECDRFYDGFGGC